MMQRTKATLPPFLLSAAIVLPLAAGVSTTGCKKDEPPPPLPSAPSVATTPTSTAPIELVPEEIPVPSASASAPPKTGTGTASTFKKCCTALTQNAANAPEPNKTYMLQAAAVCNSMVAAGQASGAIQSAIRAALVGAGMPTACQ